MKLLSQHAQQNTEMRFAVNNGPFFYTLTTTELLMAMFYIGLCLYADNAIRMTPSMLNKPPHHLRLKTERSLGTYFDLWKIKLRRQIRTFP